MSLDLFEETGNVLANLRPVADPEPGAWDNFTAGAGKVAMQTFAKAGRAASMAVAPLAMALEKEPGSTEVQDKFFKAHDETFGRAVDYWTPKPGEVGEAGQVVGQLLGTLPMVFASPAAAVAQTQLSVAEDMARKGVDAGTAQAIGATQAAGLGLGIWVPILGKTLAQRVLVGGAGFNVVQGGATRAISAQLAEGTAAEGDFKTFDPTALTLDVLLGAAFGGIAHINPRMRAEGEAWQKRLTEWGAKLKPSEVDALATLRQAQHLNADSMPGKPVDVADTNAHVDRMRQAIDDLANDRPVDVENMPAPRFEADATRAAEAEEIMKILFHGSPHVFDKFDLAKIGTGEGAHAYGRGLYFAENPEVARTYQRGLKAAFDTPSGRVKFEEMDFSDKALAADYIARTGGDFTKALAEEEAFAKTVDDPTTKESTKRVRALIEKWQKEGWQYVPPPGGLYKVSVPHEAMAKMLDWDKPFSQQKPEVQAMLSANRYFQPPKNEKPLGEWIAKLRKDGDPEIAFKELGIAGFKYLDQRSRSDGKGTSNYVIFDDALPKIIERNGEKVSPPETAPDIADPIYRSSIEAMANETGWAEVGGRMIRNEDGSVSRTAWVPNAEWWPGRPKELSEAKAKKAIQKALDGEPLKPAEQRLIDYMLDYSRERVAPAMRRLEALEETERARMANDLLAEGLDGHVRDLADYDLIRQASEIDDAALEKAAIMYQNDDAAFIREAERIVGEHASRQPNQGAAPDGGGEARQATASAARPDAGTQAAGLDPLAAEALRFAAENPDIPMFVGKNADGSDITTTPRQWLEDADAAMRQANDDVNLFEIAAGCLFGGGR